MFILYTTQDTLLRQTATNWYYDRIVDQQQQRKPLSPAGRRVVINFDDQWDEATKKKMIKHHVPFCRISRQIISNILKHEDGRGMTREGSVEYLRWIIEKLDIDKSAFNEPVDDPSEDRRRYDIWVSWAIDTICDWPNNLFQGESTGDGAGRKIDIPSDVNTTPAMRERVEEARMTLKEFIQGLSIEHETNDPPAALYEEYIPGEDEWYLPDL